MGNPRVLALALDACDKDIVLDLVEQGRLPNLASLLERAAWGPTTNPPGLFVGAVWPTLYTGISPARHGRYCFRQIVPGTYVVHNTAVETAVRGRPFWAQLSEEGKRVAVMDVPHSFVVEDLNGIQLVDWGAHDANPGFQTWPKSLADEIRGFGAHPVGIDCNGDRRSAADFQLLRDHLLAGIELRTKLAEHYLEQEPWDFFLHVFSEAHCVGHQCWHLHDPGHPRHDADVVAELGDPLPQVYAALDEAVGRLLRHAGPQTTCLVLLSHGMGPHYGGNYLLDEILRRIDRAALPMSGRVRAGARQLARSYAPTSLRRLRRARRVRRADTVARERNIDSPVVLPLNIDPRTRRCFAVPNNDVFGAVRLNIAGREPQGTVPADQVDAACEAITQELLALVNDETGTRPVVRVLRTSQHYQGDDVGDLPDLLIEWDRSWPISSVSSATIGTVEADDPETRTGDHRPEGLLIAKGPDVVPGRLPGNISSVDFAATVAALCGVELVDVDGSPIPQMTGTAAARSAD